MRSGTSKSETGHVLKLSQHNDGYLNVHLNKSGSKMHLVHRLVAQAFLAEPPASQTCVIHINHNKSDSRAENLKWVTASEPITTL